MGNFGLGTNDHGSVYVTVEADDTYGASLMSLGGSQGQVENGYVISWEAGGITNTTGHWNIGGKPITPYNPQTDNTDEVNASIESALNSYGEDYTGKLIDITRLPQGCWKA